MRLPTQIVAAVFLREKDLVADRHHRTRKSLSDYQDCRCER